MPPDDQSAGNSQASSLKTEAIPLWTVEEVASYLKLKPETVRVKVRRGELPAIKLGRVWRFRPEMIERWISQSTQSREHKINLVRGD